MHQASIPELVVLFFGSLKQSLLESLGSGVSDQAKNQEKACAPEKDATIGLHSDLLRWRSLNACRNITHDPKIHRPSTVDHCSNLYVPSHVNQTEDPRDRV